MNKPFDVAIVGAGVCGTAAAYELSKYQLDICVIEKENDVCCGVTKANSGIIHAGFDAPPGSLMAKYNVRGAEILPALAKKLDIEYINNGALVVAFSPEQIAELEKLLARGLKNGVPGLEIIPKERLFEMEPNLSHNAVAALYAPTSGIVSPWDMGLAFATVAAANGCEIMREREVLGVSYSPKDRFWEINTNKGSVFARCVINAAGLFSDKIASFAGAEGFEISPVKGQYFLLDKSQGGIFSRTIFQCPSKVGKGVLVSPTVTGNLIVGPDASDSDSRTNRSTDAAALAFIKEMAALDTDLINYRENIRNFAGLRPYTQEKSGDFLIGPDKRAPMFINIAGMKSPGLSSAAAIAEDLPAMLAGLGLEVAPKADFCDERKEIRFAAMSHEERAALVAADPSYGKIICRCGIITEGEVLAALRQPVPARTLDGVKRRCGTGMGRCQGGFCSPAIHKLISRETGIPFEQVCQEQDGSNIVDAALDKNFSGGGAF